MKKYLLIPVVAGCFALGGCSAQQVTSTAMGAASMPVKVLGSVAGAAIGSSVAGSMGTAIGSAVGAALVKSAF